MHINPTIIYGYDDFLGCRKVLKGCWGIEKRGDRFEEENIETYSWFLLHTKKKKVGNMYRHVICRSSSFLTCNSLFCCEDQVTVK